MDENLFEKLFPWPADRPLRRARFGKGPEHGEPLPGPGNLGDDQPRRQPLWLREWRDDELGVLVRVRVREDTPDHKVWAYVSSSRADYLGKAVSVGLVGEEENQLRRITVPLNETDAEGCSGAAPVGSLEELYAQLGPNVDLAVFLLE
jgi:hypothetical protein